MADLRIAHRANTAALIKAATGVEPIHGIAEVTGFTEDRQGFAVTRAILTMVGETPFAEGAADVVECDVYIVPRDRRRAVCAAGLSYDHMSVQALAGGN